MSLNDLRFCAISLIPEKIRRICDRNLDAGTGEFCLGPMTGIFLSLRGLFIIIAAKPSTVAKGCERQECCGILGELD